MVLDDKRIFLYDRRMLGSEARSSPEEVLLPRMGPEDTSSSTALNSSSSSSSGGLGRIRDELTRARQLSQFAADSLQLCRGGAAAMAVQTEALSAAIDNMRDTAAGVLRAFDGYEAKLSATQAAHQEVLDRFRDDLAALRSTPLHPLLAAAALPQQQAEEVQQLTLRDLVDGEREMVYWAEAAAAQAKGVAQLTKARALRTSLGVAVDRITAPPLPDEEVRLLVQGVEQRSAALAEGCKEVQARYREAYASSSTSEEVLGAGELLQQMERTAEEVQKLRRQLQQMAAGCRKEVLRCMKEEVAATQTDLQFRLKKEVTWMRAHAGGRSEYINHLSRIRDLPAAYTAALNEVVRRRAFAAQYTSSVESMAAAITSMRGEETRNREAFLARYGAALPAHLLADDGVLRALRDKPVGTLIRPTHPPLTN